jgi:DNA-binding LytR/AlgR family response regulator
MNQSLRCFIIDDEPPARELIEKFVRRVPFLEVIGTCSNAVDALFEVQQLQPDLIFLDVEMPEMTGFEFIRLLPAKRPAVIMITAYPHYAVDGFEHQVADYLLKPVSFERFMRAVNRVIGDLPVPTLPTPVSTPPDVTMSPLSVPSGNGPDPVSISDFLLVKEDKKLIRLMLDEIILVEGLKDYLKIHTTSRSLITHMTMTKIESMLPANLFLRVNRSYIVRQGAIREINGNQIITTDARKIPIGITYREPVLDALKKNQIR